MADFEYRPDHKGIGQLLVSSDMHKLVADRARAGMAYAISISPDAPPYGEGYIANFHVETGLTSKEGGSPRAAARLVNTSDHALAVEFANGERILGRTVDHIESGG
jgi:hypothetical protein